MACRARTGRRSPPARFAEPDALGRGNNTVQGAEPPSAICGLGRAAHTAVVDERWPQRGGRRWLYTTITRAEQGLVILA
jgi:hypothetical protein